MPGPQSMMSPLFTGKDRTRFAALRERDPQKNLIERWKKIQELRPDLAEVRLGYLPLVIENQWAVIGIPEEGFAYTIGLGYRFNQPELLIAAPHLGVEELKQMLNQLGKYVQLKALLAEDGKPVIGAGEPVEMKDFGTSLKFSAYSEASFNRFPTGYLSSFEMFFEDREHSTGGTLPVLWTTLKKPARKTPSARGASKKKRRARSAAR